MAENLVLIIVALAFLLGFVVFLLANNSHQSVPSEMDKELKEIDDKYQPLIDQMWTIYWYGRKQIEAKTQEEWDFCEKKQNEACALFVKGVENKEKERMLVYEKYGIAYPKE